MESRGAPHGAVAHAVVAIVEILIAGRDHDGGGVAGHQERGRVSAVMIGIDQVPVVFDRDLHRSHPVEARGSIARVSFHRRVAKPGIGDLRAGGRRVEQREGEQQQERRPAIRQGVRRDRAALGGTGRRCHSEVGLTASGRWGITATGWSLWWCRRRSRSASCTCGQARAARRRDAVLEPDAHRLRRAADIAS